MPIFVCAFEPDGASPAQLDFPDWIERIDFDSARSVIDSVPAARLVLIAPSPRDLLAVRLRSSSDALKSLRQTSEDIATVLKTYRRARRRILMLDLKISQRRPDLLASAVQSWRSSRAPEPRPARSAQAPADAPASIIAAALIKGEREALRLAEEFEASLTSLEVEAEDGLDLALHAAMQWRVAASAPASAPPPAGDTLASGDLEAQRAVIARLQSALDECHGELAHVYASSPKAAGSVPADMLRRLDEAELARDAMRADLAALDVEAGHLRRDNRQLREALEAIRTSNSWKITAPLRSFRGASKGAEDESVE